MLAIPLLELNTPGNAIAIVLFGMGVDLLPTVVLAVIWLVTEIRLRFGKLKVIHLRMENRC